MKSLRAKLSTFEPLERRGSVRWHVELLISAGPAHDPSRSMVRNLSETGLMLETDAALQVGETIVVDLPGADPVEARVKWHRNSAFGCEFSTPIPASVISATLLQAPLSSPDAGPKAPQLEEFPVAVGPSVNEIAEWKLNFARDKGPLGYRLVAFRQDAEGLLIALAVKSERALEAG